MLAGDAESARLADDARFEALNLRRFEKDFFLNIGAAEKQAQYAREWQDSRDRASASSSTRSRSA